MTFRSIKIIIWLISIIFSCNLTLSLYHQGAGVSEIPHSSVKVVIPSGWTAEQTVSKAEKAIISLGYVKQPNDWQKWVNILNAAELENKKNERSYKKDNFTVSYYPESDYPYKLYVIWIYFDEWKKDVFSEVGIKEYQSLSLALSSIGLVPDAQNEVDRKAARVLITPTMYNDRHPHPAREESKRIFFGLGLLLCYGTIFLWPGFWVLSNLVNRFSMPNVLKRILFIVASSLLFAPAPIPLPLLGPLPLVPLVFALPFVFESIEFLQLLVISAGCMAVLASMVSVFIWRVRLVNS